MASPVSPATGVVYPVGLRLLDRRVVVVGGGQVAHRRVAGLLRAELVAREAEHHQAPVGVLLVQLLQALVLRRQAALAGGVDHQHDLSGVLAEVLLGAVDARSAP